MKVLPFTIPVPPGHTLIVQEERLPYFYTHLHRHQEIQLTWVIEGEGTLIAGNEIQSFKSGDIFWLSPNQPHVFKSNSEYFESASSKVVHTITVFFNPFGKLQALFELPELKGLSLFLVQYSNGFKVGPAIANEVKRLITGIRMSQSADQLIKLIQLLTYFSSCADLQPFAVNSYPQSITDREGIRIGSVYDYIVQNAAKPLTLQQIASEASMTEQAFCRYFKKHTRHTFINFLNKVRVNLACKLLNDDNHISIAEVAYQCGFSSVNNFNRSFKLFTGTTPSSFRKEYGRL